MNNLEIYNKTNSDGQRFLDVFFTTLDYLTEHGTVDKDCILPYSYFLAGILADPFLKETFEKFGITFKKCIETLTNTKHPLVYIEDAPKTKQFEKLPINLLYDQIINNIKDDYYLTGKDIPEYKLEPYQIFDYSTFLYEDKINALIEKVTGIENFTETEEYFDYTTKREEKYREFALGYGVDIYEIPFENDVLEYNTENFRLVCENGRMYLFTSTGDKERVEVINNTLKNIILGGNNEILEVNDDKVTKENIEDLYDEIIRSDITKFKIRDIDTLSEVTFETENESFFGKEIGGFMIEPNNPEDEEISYQRAYERKNENNNKTPLTRYGEDLTSLEYIKDPATGRKEELDRIMKILLYPERDKSIIITGVAGCGKTALVRGLAYRIQKGLVPEALKDIKIYSIDTATLVAGTKYVGTLEEKMKSILECASKDKNIIIFIDEIHQAISGGKSEGSNNTVSEILKPYLDYGKVRVIGATTEEEYDEYIEPNTAFKTRFKKVSIKEPDYNTTYKVLDDLINSYNKISYSKLNCSPEMRKTIIDWLITSTKSTYRDYKDKSSNPRLVLDILKEAYAIAAFNESTEVTIEHLMEALKNEDRLYSSARDRQALRLKSLKPRVKKETNKILEFKPRA